MQSKPWRRMWHLLGGSFFPIIAVFIPRKTLLITVGAITAVFVTWEVVRFTHSRVNQPMVSYLGVILKTKEASRPTGTSYLLLASLIAFLSFEKYVAISCLLFLSVGDAMATIIGEKYGRRRLFNKSLEGSLACLLVCLLIGVIMVVGGKVMLLPVAVVGAVTATMAELLPFPVDDNLTIPIFSGGTMTLTDFVLARL